MADLSTDAAPVLSADQLARLHDRMDRQEVAPGDVLFRAGDRTYDFILIDSGEVDIIRLATPDAPEAVVTTHGAGRFLGELNMLTGQSVYLTAQVRSPGVVFRLDPDGFRQLMSEDVEISDLILRAFMARREVLRIEAARSLEILGSRMCAHSNSLRTWAARQGLPHLWLDLDEPEGQALAAALNVENGDLPIVVTPTETLRRATAGSLAELVGLSYRSIAGKVYDVVVVGGGPAGLAAAVYGASEGLDTMLLDSASIGGQAAASSRIENYLGFPSGLSGAHLMDSGLLQAQKFGAHVATPCRASEVHVDAEQLMVTLSDGTDVATRAVIIASGASYSKLPLADWDRFEGTGIFYAATELEARECGANPVTVVGGANSAGQAAIYLAERGSEVTLAIRGADIDKDMSAYLVNRIAADPKITVRTHTEVTALSGERSLESISLTDRATGDSSQIPCRGLFCFIGAKPATGWLAGVTLDAEGFVLTDQQLDEIELGPTWDLLGRRPLPFETSIPSVFAAGDVRRGSMKRVAAAVGEGASAIRSVHAAIGATV